jgi:hypothetical protein
MADRYERPVRHGRECAHKSSAQAAHFSLGDYMFEIQHQRGGERAHQRDQGDVSSCRFCRAETVRPPTFQHTRPHSYCFIPAFACGDRRWRVLLMALEGERMLHAGGFPSNPILSGSTPNIDYHQKRSKLESKLFQVPKIIVMYSMLR